MEKKSFKFYTSWNEAIKKMDEQQVRTFINNLCNYAEGKEIKLTGLMEEIMWSQVQPLLDYNEGMRQKKIENGRKGGIAKSEKKSDGNQELPNLPNSTKSYQTYQDLPMKEDDDVDDDRRKKKMIVEGDVDSRKKIVNSLLKIMKEVIKDGLVTEEQVKEWKINDTRDALNIMFKDYSDWETDFTRQRLDDFIYNVSLKSKVAIDYKLHALLKAHQIL